MKVHGLKNLLPAQAFGLIIFCLFAAGCREAQTERPNAPRRDISTSRSTVSGTGGEVGVATAVSVRLLDARGLPAQLWTPTVSLVTSGGAAVAGSSAGACTVSDRNGNSTCTVTSSTPGSYYIKVTSPVSFTSSAAVTFSQITRSLSFSVQPSTPVNAGTVIPTQPVVQLLDRVGNLNTSGTETVTIALTSPGSATLAGTTSVAAVAGVATFAGLAVNLAGTYTFTASASSITSATSLSFVISAGTGARVAFTTQPSASTAANIAFAQQPIVTFQDANGNAVSSTCSVTLSLTSGTGTLLGTTTKTAVAGVADFAGLNLRINTTAGGSGYVLTATPNGACAGYTAATSNAFTITLAGVPYSLELSTPPSTSSLNEVWATQPVVRVLDVNGDLASSDSTTVVTITKTAGPTGTLNGPVSVQAVNGVATFSGLSITSNDSAQAGSYTLDIDATHPDVAGFTNLSHSLTINANGMVASRLLFQSQPASTSVNASLAAFQVRVVDVNGYLCTACSNSITVSYYYGSPSTGTMGGTATRSAVAGVATFTGISFTTAGVKQIDATAASLTSAYSNLFSITSYGTASKLAFTTQPSRTASTGTNAWDTQPVVAIQDVAGNTVSSDSTTQVTLSCAQPTSGCTLIGTTTVTAVNGVATFTDLRTSQTGLTGIVLQAVSSPSYTTTQSSSFNGNP